MKSVLFGLLLASQAHALKVMIDPGHGGNDAGAFREGVKESDLTLKLAQKLHLLIQKNSAKNSAKDGGLESTLTRDTDVSVGLKERVEMAVAQDCDLFVSLHANASTDPRASGAEFYFQNQLEADQNSFMLAHHENQKSLENSTVIQRKINLESYSADLKNVFLDLMDQARIRSSFELSKHLREEWSGQRKSKSTSIKQAPFHVVSRTPIPSTLVEIGFLTNPNDFHQLQSEAYLQEVAESLYQGLLAYKISTKIPADISVTKQ